MALPVIFDSLQKGDPEFYAQLASLQELAMDQGVLDAKTKFLLGLAVNVCLERSEKVQCALGQARAAGASLDEVRDVLRLTYFIKGVGTAQEMAQVLK